MADIATAQKGASACLGARCSTSSHERCASPGLPSGTGYRRAPLLALDFSAESSRWSPHQRFWVHIVDPAGVDDAEGAPELVQFVTCGVGHPLLAVRLERRERDAGLRNSRHSSGLDPEGCNRPILVVDPQGRSLRLVTRPRAAALWTARDRARAAAVVGPAWQPGARSTAPCG